jgi:predicted PurR-regulated permease PerM
MNQPTRISYVIMAVLLVLIGCFHLGTLVLTAFFGFFALQVFSLGRSKFLGMVLYIIAVVTLGSGMFYFGKQAVHTVPTIIEQSFPAVTQFAQKQGIVLPFTDYESLKLLVMDEVKQDVVGAGRHAREAGFKFIQLVIGLVVAASMFLNTRWGSENEPGTSSDSLYATVVRELSLRFQTFFRSFSKVIGAQIIISAINTTLTAAFLLWNDFRFVPVLIMMTFVCGLLPIIGNIISNTLIIGVAFTIPENGPRMALISLVFLVVIHKLEYFLNSKIIGDRIKNPMWLTLIGLVLGEKLMGVPGIILAPVVLHYIKVEASKNKVAVGSAPD